MEMVFSIPTQEMKQWKQGGNKKSHQGTHKELSPSLFWRAVQGSLYKQANLFSRCVW